MKKIKIVMTIVCIGCLVAFTVPAHAISITADDLIGTVVPGTAADPSDEIIYLQKLVDMYNTGTPTSPYTDTGDGNREYELDVGINVPGSLPTPVTYGTTNFDTNNAVGYNIIDEYIYMGAKFGTDLAFYYLGGATGIIEDLYSPFGTQGGGLSHIVFFNRNYVPEPTTLLLLGFGLVGLAGFRRK